MALPQTADLVIPRGADFNFTLRILDSKGDAAVLTGGSTSFKAEIREDHKKPLIAAFTITPQTGDDAGDLLFELSAAQTLTLDPRNDYKWDFFWTNVTGAVTRVAYGDVSVEPNITHL